MSPKHDCPGIFSPSQMFVKKIRSVLVDSSKSFIFLFIINVVMIFLPSSISGKTISFLFLSVRALTSFLFTTVDRCFQRVIFTLLYDRHSHIYKAIYSTHMYVSMKVSCCCLSVTISSFQTLILPCTHHIHW